jgi:hypothetical protein
MHLGCEELKIRLASVRPRVHIFGHIHDAYGVAQSRTTVYANACSCDEDYRATHRPIVLDVLQKSIEIQGIEPNLRQAHLERLEKGLKNIEECSEELSELPPYMVPMRYLRGLSSMAEIRDMTEAALLQSYLERGLQADLARQLRAESKPSKRLIPFSRLEDASAEE